MSTIQSNPAKYARLTSEIEELLEAWQVLKNWKRPKEMDFSKFFERSYKGDWYEGCRFDQNQKPLHDPTKYTQK